MKLRKTIFQELLYRIYRIKLIFKKKSKTKYIDLHYILDSIK